MEVPSIFLNRILAESAKRNAMSLHLAVGSQPTVRVAGELMPIEGEDIVSADLAMKLIGSLLSEEENKKLTEEKELIIVKELSSGFNFRINIFFQKNLPSLSFFYIPKNIKSLSEMKLPKILNNLTKLNSGLFIVAGPFHSGKTTTAAALIEEFNKTNKKNIITLEDPIEYLFVSKKSIISQRQLGRDVKSIVQGLEYCLEEDADLIYIGEIKKDFDSAAPLILELAAGNSLVILEINADSSIRAIEKILNSLEKKVSMEAARYSLADNLLGVMAQRLLPHRGGGMVMAAEILLASGAVKSLIREGKIYQLDSVIQTSRKEGMISMEKSLEELIKDGEIKQEDADGVKLEN